jgi:hypothetical protein
MWLLLTYFCKRPKVVIIDGISSCYRSCTDEERGRGGEWGGDGVRRAGESLRLPIHMGTAGGMRHSTQQVPNLHKLENSLATAPDVDLLKVEQAHDDLQSEVKWAAERGTLSRRFGVPSAWFLRQ